MKYSSRNLPADSPLANLLVIIVGTLLIAASIVLGFFAFVVVASVLKGLSIHVEVSVGIAQVRISNQAVGFGRHQGEEVPVGPF